MSNLPDKIKEILNGIDDCETDSDDGWWETGTGAAFGKQKLNEILRVASEYREMDKKRMFYLYLLTLTGHGYDGAEARELFEEWYKNGA